MINIHTLISCADSFGVLYFRNIERVFENSKPDPGDIPPPARPQLLKQGHTSSSKVTPTPRPYLLILPNSSTGD